MTWLGGIETDFTGFTGEQLCDKLALEMYDYEEDQLFECEEFLQNAALIIDFDSETSMEGFSTPYIGSVTVEYYSRIIGAFRAIGDDHDADILSEALRLDTHYTKLLDDADSDAENDALYKEFSSKLGELEKELYTKTDFDVWSLLYDYVDRHIR